jgi:hypothetical protein
MAALRAWDALERFQVRGYENLHPASAAFHHLEWFAIRGFRGAHGVKVNIAGSEDKGAVAGAK